MLHNAALLLSNLESTHSAWDIVIFQKNAVKNNS